MGNIFGEIRDFAFGELQNLAEYQNYDAIAGLIINMDDRTVMCWQGSKWITYFMHCYCAPGEVWILTGVQHLKRHTGNGQYRLQ